MTGRQSLPMWIFALQEVLFREAGNRKDTKVAWKNKTNKAGSVQEIELKVSSINAKTGSLSHSYTISIYLASGLIFFKGCGYQSFVKDIFPKCCQVTSIQCQSPAIQKERTDDSPKRDQKNQSVASNHISPDQKSSIQENLEQINKINFVQLAHLFQDESKQLQVRYAKQEERLQKLEKSILDKVDKKLSTIQEAKHQEESQSEINFMAQIKSLEANIDILNEELTTKDKIIGQLQRERKKLEVDLNQSETFIKTKVSQLDKAHQELDYLHSQLKASKAGIDETDHLKSLCAKLENENELLHIKNKPPVQSVRVHEEKP